MQATSSFKSEDFPSSHINFILMRIRKNLFFLCKAFDIFLLIFVRFQRIYSAADKCLEKKIILNQSANIIKLLFLGLLMKINLAQIMPVSLQKFQFFKILN